MTPRACPVCGVAHAACGAGRSLRYPPVDVPLMSHRRNPMAELGLYEVQQSGNLPPAVLKLSDEEAEAYGDRAKRIGDAKPAEPQPVTQPPYAVDVETGKPVTSGKKAPAAQNKGRHAAEDKG